MRTIIRGSCFTACLVAVLALPAWAQDKPAEPNTKGADGVYAFTMNSIDGKPVKLDSYKGDVLLIVNVASQCGLTEANYKGLGPLFDKYKDQGFRVLAFPANNFGGQEPGTNQEIKSFCATKYGVKYELFSKVSVKGDDICPLYKYLTEHPDKEIKGEVAWNFQKYLIGRDGKVFAKFSPRTKPDDDKLVAAIDEALKEKAPSKP